VKNCSGFQVWQFMGRLVLLRAYRCLEVGLWKNIRKGWEKFLGPYRFEVGDGASAKFWHDTWCTDAILKEAFPALFGIARVKDASVVREIF
jgi:hypothetical protein